MTVALGAMSAAAQDEPPLVDVRVRGLAEIEPAPKDAAAHAALMTLGDRLRRLPNEIPDMDIERSWIDAAWRVATGGLGLRVVGGERAPSVFVSLTPNGGTEGLVTKLTEMLDESRADFTVNEDGSLTLDSPGGDLFLGEARVDGRAALALRMGEGEPASVTPERFDLSADAKPMLSASIRVGDLIAIARGMIEREEPEVLAQIDRFGFLNAGDATLDVAFGGDGAEGHFAARLSGAKPWLGRFMGDSAFETGHLAVVPEDATVVWAATADLQWLVEVIDALGEDSGRDFLGQIQEGFGVDLDAGLLSNVGPRWIYYQSDATGGGGVLSGVAIAELRDADAFAETLASGMAHANQAGGAFGRGYGRTREWQTGGHAAWSIVFPGLPVPLELSWSIVDDHLVAAVSPNGLAAAVAQFGAGRSVLDNGSFKQAITDRWPGGAVASIGYVDAARFAAKGYGTVNLGTSALANAVRLPFVPDAEPGQLMPSYAAFVGGIRPTGAIASWDGDDLIQRGTFDGSFLVQAAVSVGQSSGWQSMYMPGMMAGTLLPALGKARQSAQQLKAATQVRSVVQAAIIWSTDNPEQPASVGDLIGVGLLTPEMLDSPVADAWDGGPEIVLRQTFQNGGGQDSFDASQIIAMDRAAYINGESVVNVGFADGHVEAISSWDLDERLDEPQNVGAREEFELD